MRKAAIFMSDFHLGQKDRMEEFHADEEFAELLARLSRQHAEDDVDLVLLGDVMDLWTTITDDREVNAQTAADVDLYVPVPSNDPQARTEAVQKELRKVQAVMDAHPGFFEALSRFLTDNPLNRNRRILYIPGNHDHSVVEPTLQAEIRNRILQKNQPLAHKIMFQHYYEDQDLRVYAEHGNQLTYGGAFKYPTFKEFGEECPGYYELKLIWNRLERRAPEMDNVFMGALSPAMWPGLFWWLLIMGNLRHWQTLRKFQTQYEHDSRAAKARERMPAPWKTVIHCLRAKWSATGDEFWDQVPQLFDVKGQGMAPLIGHRLDPREIKTVILGHSHHTKDRDLPGLEGVKYYNTGSWIFRYENGRRIVEQTWLEISCDMPAQAGGNGSGRSTIDRRLFRRNVELPRVDSGPVTSDGRALNPAMREMPDLRVGDVVLFHWNFGATVTRLLRSFRIIELIFHQIPHMVTSWLNRYGSSSYWSHAALVYASPTEPEESEEYNDPLFLEALPVTGVGIHGPDHYVAHRNEWNLAILRPRAPWLNEWKNRRLLRRMAVSVLDAEYDDKEIARWTLVFSTRMMDQQEGQALVTGLFKGGVMGVALSTLALLGWGLRWLNGQVQENGLRMLRAAATDRLSRLRGRATDLLSHLGVMDALRAVWNSGDWLLILIVTGLVLAMAVTALLAFREVLRAILIAWARATASVGAAWGALIAPVMAELSDGWERHSPLWRWVFTGIWCAIPLGTVFVALTRNYTANEASAMILALSVAVVWASYPMTKIIELLVGKPWDWLKTGFKQLSRWLFKRLGWTLIEKPQPAPLFICSGLVQYSLAITAKQLRANPGEVIANPDWRPGLSALEEDALLKKTIHQDFADSPHFDWIYLLIDGRVTHKPDASHRAEVEPDRLKKIKTRRLSWLAAWSLRFALLGLLLTLLYGLNPFGHGELQTFWLYAGALSGLAAIRLAREAGRRLALDPIGLRGRWLTRWGGRLGYAALAGSLVTLSG